MKIRFQISDFRFQKPLIGKLTLFFVFCFFKNLYSQNTALTAAEKKPKIGLVLSGGGGKGYAHIGVLKVLENAGVKVDYIGGTSMGAVVGGLYAAGYNAAQVDSIFRASDFNDVLLDQIPRTSKTFYEKRNDELYAVTLPFNKFKVGLPTGYSKGLYLYNLLNKLFHDVRHVNDFNQLPIPFLCMATDIEKGEQVILNKGSLAKAISASANFPTLYSPIDIDGKWLVDGGVTNNYPVEEVKKLGADIIIGVDVQEGSKERNSLTDAAKILTQIVNFQMNEKIKPKKEATTIYIKPDVSNYGVFSFDKLDEIEPIGEKAANKVIDLINKYGSNYYKPPLKTSKESNFINVASIGNNELKNYTRSYLLGKLKFRGGDKISYPDLKRGIENLNATQNFGSISYKFEKNGDRDNLILQLEENKTNTFLKFGMHYDGLFKSGLLANITQKKLFFKNDVISLDGIFGDNFRYNFDYYIDNGFYWSFGIKSRMNQFNRNIPSNSGDDEVFSNLGLSTVNINFRDFTQQAYVQTLFKQKFVIGAGLELKTFKLSSDTFEAENSTFFIDSDYLSGFTYFKYDSFDDLFFPSKGWFFKGEYKYYGLTTKKNTDFTKYSQIKADFGIAQTFFKIATLKIEAEAGTSVGRNTIPILDYRLGGYGFDKINNFNHFFGYDFLALAGNSFIKASGTADFEFIRKNHINFTANFANIEDNLFETPKWIKTPQYTGFAMGYGLETIVGPIELKTSYSPETKKALVWFSLGFWF
jgi:NTE family protein